MRNIESVLSRGLPSSALHCQPEKRPGRKVDDKKLRGLTLSLVCAIIITQSCVFVKSSSHEACAVEAGGA